MHEPLKVFLAAYGAVFVLSVVLCAVGFRRSSPLRRRGLLALTYAAWVPMGGTFALVVSVVFDRSQGGPLPLASIFVPALMLLSGLFLAISVVVNALSVVGHPSTGKERVVESWPQVHLLFAKILGIAVAIIAIPYAFLVMGF